MLDTQSKHVSPLLFFKEKNYDKGEEDIMQVNVRMIASIMGFFSVI